jgi:hypothetical protein
MLRDLARFHSFLHMEPSQLDLSRSDVAEDLDAS